MSTQEKEIKALEKAYTEKEQSSLLWEGYDTPGFFPHHIIEAYVNLVGSDHNLGSSSDEVFVKTNRLQFHCPISEINLLDLGSLIQYFSDKLNNRNPSKKIKK